MENSNSLSFAKIRGNQGNSLLIFGPNPLIDPRVSITLLNQLSALSFPGMISDKILALVDFKNVLMYYKEAWKTLRNL